MSVTTSLTRSAASTDLLAGASVIIALTTLRAMNGARGPSGKLDVRDQRRWRIPGRGHHRRPAPLPARGTTIRSNR